MPDSADPQADARVLMRCIGSITNPEKASVAYAFTWVGIDLAIQQRAVAIALLAELELMGERQGVLDHMRTMLRQIRKPIYPKEEK